MAVKLGHASKDEISKYKGGAAGDQTAKEVRTLSWWNNSWTTVFRPKDSAKAEKIAKAMEQACANNNIGYDQNQRATLYTYAKAVGYDLSKVTQKCECDCSSLVAVCCLAAGISVSYSMYTAIQKSVLAGTGAFTVLTESKYLTSSDYLKRGDILLSSGHTAVVLSNGTKAEVKTQSNSSTTSKGENTVNIEMSVLSRGSEGEQVKTLQRLLMALGYDLGKHGADGDFGSATYNAVIKFQRKEKLGIDGVVGKNTWIKLLKG